MMRSFHCFTCKKVFAGVEGDRCPSCGGTNGEWLSPERLQEGMERGAYYNVDPGTGNGAKIKK